MRRAEARRVAGESGREESREREPPYETVISTDSAIFLHLLPLLPPPMTPPPPLFMPIPLNLKPAT